MKDVPLYCKVSESRFASGQGVRHTIEDPGALMKMKILLTFVSLGTVILLTGLDSKASDGEKTQPAKAPDAKVTTPAPKPATSADFPVIGYLEKQGKVIT